MFGVGLSFFLVAILYASVGFGGGSSYLAILSYSDFDYRIIPVVGLLCNLTVTGQATMQWLIARKFPWKELIPFLMASVPAAYLGGRFAVSETFFFVVLASVLTVSGVILVFDKRCPIKQASTTNGSKPFWQSGLLGLLIGGVSGVSGIGGGIFLSPILNTIRWAAPSVISGMATGFIFFNSLSGLVGQIQKGQMGWEGLGFPVVLMGIVLAGGFIGTRLQFARFNSQMILRITGLLVLLAAGRIWLRLM